MGTSRVKRLRFTEFHLSISLSMNFHILKQPASRARQHGVAFVPQLHVRMLDEEGSLLGSADRWPRFVLVKPTWQRAEEEHRPRHAWIKV